MYKCEGCGVLSDKKLCDRCFRIRHYNEYKSVNIDTLEIDKILNNIDVDDLTVLVIDLLNIPKDLKQLKDKIKSKTILVLTKFDLMPTNNYERYIKYFDKYKDYFLDILCISSKNNYNIDRLYDIITSNTSKNVYFVGYTNAGKSSLINKLIYNYSNIDTSITTSAMPNTTLSLINIKINDISLIDTPGIIDNNDNVLTIDLLKKIQKSKRIKPITYQVKNTQYIVIEDIIKLEVSDNNINIYVPSNFKVLRSYKDNNILNDHDYKEYRIDKISDIVIPGVGFIKVKPGTVKIKSIIDNIFIRDNLI